MFCYNCGTRIDNSNQKFCHNCGCELSPNFRQSRSMPVGTMYQNPNIIQYPPAYNYASITDEGKPGSTSIKCLVFSLVSIGIAIVGVFVSAPFLFFQFLIIGFVLSLAIHITGLIFGIFSKKYANKASDLEPINPVEQIGSVLCYFGIVFNAIGIGATLIALPILLAISR